jgi:hypothetical protein
MAIHLIPLNKNFLPELNGKDITATTIHIAIQPHIYGAVSHVAGIRRNIKKRGRHVRRRL